MRTKKFHYNKELGKSLPCKAEYNCPHAHHFDTRAEAEAFAASVEEKAYDMRIKEMTYSASSALIEESNERVILTDEEKKRVDEIDREIKEIDMKLSDFAISHKKTMQKQKEDLRKGAKNELELAFMEGGGSERAEERTNRHLNKALDKQRHASRYQPSPFTEKEEKELYNKKSALFDEKKKIIDDKLKSVPSTKKEKHITLNEAYYKQLNEAVEQLRAGKITRDEFDMITSNLSKNS